MKAKVDRAAVMRDAHRRYANAKRLGLDWSFGRCLSTAWQVDRIRRHSNDHDKRAA
jgi:hypothetical protein